MQGDDKIGATVKGLNQATIPFADIIQQLADKADRDWVVQFDSGGANQKSRFQASKENVKLILRIGDLTGSGNLRVRMCVAGVAGDYDIVGKAVAEEEA